MNLSKFESLLIYLDGKKMIFISFATVILGILEIFKVIDASFLAKCLTALNLIGGSAALTTNYKAGAENQRFGSALRAKSGRGF